MNAKDVIRAWKDSAYRNSLSEEQRAMRPENPAGLIELKELDLDAVAGGFGDDDPSTEEEPGPVRPPR